MKSYHRNATTAATQPRRHFGSLRQNFNYLFYAVNFLGLFHFFPVRDFLATPGRASTVVVLRWVRWHCDLTAHFAVTFYFCCVSSTKENLEEEKKNKTFSHRLVFRITTRKATRTNVVSLADHTNCTHLHSFDWVVTIVIDIQWPYSPVKERGDTIYWRGGYRQIYNTKNEIIMFQISNAISMITRS